MSTTLRPPTRLLGQGGTAFNVGLHYKDFYGALTMLFRRFYSTWGPIRVNTRLDVTTSR